MLSFLSAHSKPEDFPTQFSNQIYYSDISQFESFSYDSVYSIKYVSHGEERYSVNGRELEINSGEFLIVNDQSHVSLKPSAKGQAISIFIDPSTLLEAFYNLQEEEQGLLDDPLLTKEQGPPLFYEGVFEKSGSTLGPILQQTFSQVSTCLSHNISEIEKANFYQLSEKLIRSQIQDLKALKQLKFVKVSTRQELLRRLKIAQEFLHDHPFDNFYLDEIAQVAALSPYHFHRSFTRIFGLSPLKYHQQLKISKAQKALLNSDESINDLALKLGFADSSSFGRAFKRNLGFSPIEWKKSNLKRLLPKAPG